ncbi:hypothetical protein C8Q80DRAFT_103440 [Daedaleopsis nitida]|nr:hypothetical protein C8Q80DRAFT_103440 [Daedaleopsis nitida]
MSRWVSKGGDNRQTPPAFYSHRSLALARRRVSPTRCVPVRGPVPACARVPRTWAFRPPAPAEAYSISGSEPTRTVALTSEYIHKSPDLPSWQVAGVTEACDCRQPIAKVCCWAPCAQLFAAVTDPDPIVCL